MGNSSQNDTVVKHDAVIEFEKSLFASFIAVTAFLAVPPNVLLLWLAKGGKKKGRPQISEPAARFPLLLISQSVSHMLISVTSPLDVLFLLRNGRDGVECAVMLSVKSVLMLFSVLSVSLHGLDKVYRVKNIRQPFLHVRTCTKVAAIVAAFVISTVPLVLELILSEGRPLQDGCKVTEAVVDVTEVIFVLGCVVSMISFVTAVYMLHRHSRRVTASDGRKPTSESEMTTYSVTSSKLPSVSEVVMGEPADDRPMRNTAQVPAEDKDSLLRRPVPSAVTMPAIPDSAINHHDMAIRTSTPTCLLQCPSVSVTLRPSSGHHTSQFPLLPPIRSSCIHDNNGTNQNYQCSSVTQELPLAKPLPTTISPTQNGHASSGNKPKSVRSPDHQMGDVRTSKQRDRVKFKPHHTRQPSSTLTTRNRLQSATVTATKRGILTIGIFLVCYLPLMVTLFVLSLDSPVYETALLLEGLTLPISYVHALLSPVLVIRLDQEWKQQAAVLLSRCLCWKKDNANHGEIPGGSKA